MQFSNALLLVIGVAALAINPVLDHLAAAIAGLFRRLDRSRRARRAVRAHAGAPVASLRGHDDSAPCGCG